MKRLRRCLKNSFSFSWEVLLSRKSHLGYLPQLQCYSNPYVQSWTLLVWVWTVAVIWGPMSQTILGLSLGGLGQWQEPWPHSTETMAAWGHLQIQGVWSTKIADWNVLFVTSEKKNAFCKAEDSQRSINWWAYYIVTW